MGLTRGRRVSFCQVSQAASFPVSHCWGRYKRACTPSGVCSGGCRGVQRGLGLGGKWHCFSLLPQLEELARAAGGVCV